MDKIVYIINSLTIVKNLISIQCTSYLARVLARIFIVRIDDFIALTRIYNNTSTTNPKLKKKIKKDINALNELYEEFLREQRHKFSAHFQDKTLFERIKLWAEIDESKITFFYQQILDIYKLFEHTTGYKNINFNPNC